MELFDKKTLLKVIRRGTVFARMSPGIILNVYTEDRLNLSYYCTAPNRTVQFSVRKERTLVRFSSHNYTIFLL